MYGSNQIIISKVSNGWTVQMPAQPGADLDDRMANIARIMIKKIQSSKDPVLEALEEKVEEPRESENKIKADNTLFIFTTFDEVLGFLKFTII